MNILLTNDDGITSPGLRALIAAFSGAGHRVLVCAPDRERSASSHSVTLTRPLHARPMDLPGADRAWAVDGTPSDCARLGLYLTRREGVDLVVSGINRGMNQGGACVYSGTVGAALEASMSGTQAMAVSLCTVAFGDGDDNDYGPAARLAVRVAEWQREHPQPRGVILNLNVPVLPYERIKGIVPATLAPVFLETPAYVEGADDQGPNYLYCNGDGLPLDDPEYDVVRSDRGYATLTRLTWDFRLNGDDSELGSIEI